MGMQALEDQGGGRLEVGVYSSMGLLFSPSAFNLECSVFN